MSSMYAVSVCLIMLIALNSPATGQSENPRLMILTDIGGDPDDIQSLRRLLMYSNEFRIEGLVATATRGDKPKHLRRRPPYFILENHIFDAIDDYETVRDNLALHAPGYPTAAALRNVVKKGQHARGVENLEAGLATPGSRHIITAVDASDEPLYISIWGGAHDLAQALLDVKTDRTEEEVKQFISKIRVYAINDQDKKYNPEKGTGEWIKENFPSIFYIEAGPEWITRPESTAGYRGMYQNESNTPGQLMKSLVKPGQEFNQQAWVEENINQWGPLGKGYPPDVNINPDSKRNTTGVKEGDTPSWFYVLRHGLNDPSHPEWGGWGGRFEHLARAMYTDAQDDHWSGEDDGSLRRKWTVARWREAYQNDFAARMRWCVLSYEEANHHPLAIIGKDDGRDVIVMKAKKGQRVKLDARASRDPDGNPLSFRWWNYHEVSSVPAIIKNENKRIAEVEIPENASSGEVHVILEVLDEGSPRLVSYRRVVLKIQP